MTILYFLMYFISITGIAYYYQTAIPRIIKDLECYYHEGYFWSKYPPKQILEDWIQEKETNQYGMKEYADRAIEILKKELDE